jgi:drug/metabolite transporter (DMT)-like permease
LTSLLLSSDGAAISVYWHNHQFDERAFVTEQCCDTISGIKTNVMVAGLLTSVLAALVLSFGAAMYKNFSGGKTDAMLSFGTVTVESVGALLPEVLFSESVKVLEEKCQRILSELS